MSTYYKRTPVQNEICITSFISFHYFEYVKSFEGILEQHDFWELVYVDYGNVRVISDDKEYFVSSGNGVLHAPNESHNLLSMGDFASAFIISFDCDSESLKSLSGGVLRFGREDAEIIRNIYRLGKQIFEGPYDIFDQQRLMVKQDAPYGGLQIIKNLTEWLFLRLVQNASQKSKELQKSAHNAVTNEKLIVNKIIGIISLKLYEKLSLDDICCQISFSKSYILKVFKKHMNCGVMDYYNQMKIKEAKRLISEGRYTYTEIARLLNYSSVHHFSKKFKQVTKMTPSGYQKSVKIRGVI